MKNFSAFVLSLIVVVSSCHQDDIENIIDDDSNEVIMSYENYDVISIPPNHPVLKSYFVSKNARVLQDSLDINKAFAVIDKESSDSSKYVIGVPYLHNSDSVNTTLLLKVNTNKGSTVTNGRQNGEQPGHGDNVEIAIIQDVSLYSTAPYKVQHTYREVGYPIALRDRFTNENRDRYGVKYTNFYYATGRSPFWNCFNMCWESVGQTCAADWVCDIICQSVGPACLAAKAMTCSDICST